MGNSTLKKGFSTIDFNEEHEIDGTHQKPISHLTTSLPVFTDANKKLESKSIVDTLTALQLPVGMEIMWPTETVPVGWLEEDGASLLRAGTYAALFAVIGTMYGTADETHFNLPDMRGKFPRIWAHGSTNDPDRAARTAPGATGATLTAGDHVGTEQVDGFKSHLHDIGFSNPTSGFAQTAGGYYAFASGSGSSSETGGNETRPVNTNLMFIIRYQ
jgi:hypothetical protein